jgi:DNA replication ATP-dependent helicase Dna2
VQAAAAPSWLSLARDPEWPLLWLDTRNVPSADTLDHGSFHNACEACICARIAAEFVALGLPAAAVGITSPYSQQIKRISTEMEAFPALAGASAMTVDKFQGQDRAVMLVSLVRSNAEASPGVLLADFRRVNVALTRAKTKLIIVGDSSTVAVVPVVAAMLTGVQNFGRVVDLAAHWEFATR